MPAYGVIFSPLSIISSSNLGSGVVKPLAQVVNKAVAPQASSNFVAARHLAAIGPPWAQNIFLPDLVTMTNHMPGHTTEAAVPFRQNRISSLAGKVHFSALASHPLNLGLTYGRLQGTRA